MDIKTRSGLGGLGGLGLLVLTLVAAPPAPAHAQVGCRFQLGFADLARLLGPDRAGSCLEGQRTAFNGNAEQKTTAGLMVWRKADNWTAFTDGYRTWINGPNGVEVRLNGQRFAWEPDAGAFGTTPAEPVPAPPPVPAAPPTVGDIGVSASSNVLSVTVVSVDRFATPAADPGKELLRVTVKLAPGKRGIGAYNWGDFRVRSREGYEVRPDSTTPKLAHGLDHGGLSRDQWVQGDLVFQVATDATGLTLIHEPQGVGVIPGVITRRLDVLA